MKCFELWRHNCWSDVAIMPIKIRHIPAKKGYWVRCNWYNIVNPKNIHDVGVVDKIFIKDVDMKNWVPYES